MDQVSTDNVNRPTGWLRVLLALIACGLLCLFVVALRLEPDPRGFGTHQQLGLPACQFRSLTGLHCPHCGMTTSFSNIVRGRFDAAWQANPLGIPLFTVLALSVPWCLATSVAGRWIGTQEPFRWLVFGTIFYLVLALILWGVRILL